ncbi:MAG: hypothetical protein WAU91_10885 [Desulfatitalea sp.]
MAHITLLAEAGLLDGRTATTNWQFARQFERRYPQVHLRMDRILTEQDGILCAGATSAIMHLGLHLIRRFGSEDLAAVCAKAFLVDPNRGSISVEIRTTKTTSAASGRKTPRMSFSPRTMSMT